jgi:PleD family two-component response regulator
MSQGRILVVEDDADISNLLRIYFKGEGYKVSVAQRGEDALDSCRHRLPDVIVLDIMLPDMDGYDVCRELRNSLRTSHIPIIFLTQKDERSDKIRGLELGADDYVTKPFDVEELNLRVRNAMARSKYESLTNPTTGLPSGQLIEERLRQLMRDGDWAIVYVGVTGLDAFTEAYGFVAGEEVLRFAAMILTQTVDRVGTLDDFIGHVGSDEFIVVTKKGQARRLAGEVKKRFNANVGTHYDWQAREQGYLVVEDQDGNETRVDLMRLAVGVITADDGPFADIREITEAAAEARRRAVRADQAGSSED